jgi:cytochrome P450
VTSILPAANYDPAVFANPREVNFHRPRKPVFAFGGGVHSCMGAHLARLEIKIAITEFLRRIPDFQVKEGTRIEYWPGGVVGPKAHPFQGVFFPLVSSRAVETWDETASFDA